MRHSRRPHDRLPDGFGVRLDPRARTYSGGRFLVGVTGRTVLRLPPSSAALLGDGFLEVTDPHSATVARSLLDAGVANPRPHVLPSKQDVTLVVVVRDDREALERIYSVTRGYNLVIVDDGSTIPVASHEVSATAGREVTIVRHELSRGAVAARNAGISAATTEFVALMDIDVTPRTGWLEATLGHFADPAVALVAPRIVSEPSDPAGSSLLTRYERSRGPLDFGRREHLVQSDGPVHYAPSAAMVARRSVLLDHGGFDETLASGADVDLCWRLEEAGWRLRYEPIATVLRGKLPSFGEWLGEKFADGQATSLLAERHPGRVASIVLSPWSAIAIAFLATISKVGVFGAAVTWAAWIAQLRRSLTEVDQPTRVATLFAARGMVAGMWRMISVLCRHYWPVTLIAALLSRNVRQVVVALAVAEGAFEWLHHHQPGGLDPLRYIVLKRVEDLAFGAGVWRGAISNRNVDCLLPFLRD